MEVRSNTEKLSLGPDGLPLHEKNLNLKNCWHLFARHTSVVEPPDSIHTALKIMAHKGFRHLPVVNRDRESEVLGMVSAQDLIDLISAKAHHLFTIWGTLEESGDLLRSLQNPVSTIMNDRPITITPDKTILDAIRLMSEKNIGALIIVQEGKKADGNIAKGLSLVGIITLRDIVSIMAAFAPFGTRVVDNMTYEPKTIDDNDTIYSALDLLSRNQIRRLPVISSKKDGRVEGMVTNKMIFRFFESVLAYNYPKVGIDSAYEQPVKTIMMSPMPLTDPNEDCGTVAYLMRELGTGGFAVGDSRGLVGLITERDLVKRIYDKKGISFFSDLFFSKPRAIYA
jgi:CBS domain-containing protein